MQIGNRILSIKSLVNWCSNLYFVYLPAYFNLGTNYRKSSSKNQIGSDWIFGWESPNFGNLSSNSYNTNQNSSVSFDACHNRARAILKSHVDFHSLNSLGTLETFNFRHLILKIWQNISWNSKYWRFKWENLHKGFCSAVLT